MAPQTPGTTIAFDLGELRMLNHLEIEWGTTYASNLRLFMSRHTEDSWLKVARNFKPRPPMPWFNLHVMNERDLRALYRYIRSIGPAGEPAPEYVPPGRTPRGPAIQFPG